MSERAFVCMCVCVCMCTKHGRTTSKRVGTFHARPDTGHEHRTRGRHREQHGRVGHQRERRAEHALRGRTISFAIQIPGSLSVRLALGHVHRLEHTRASAHLQQRSHLPQHTHRRVVARSKRAVRLLVHSEYALQLQVQVASARQRSLRCLVSRPQ